MCIRDRFSEDRAVELAVEFAREASAGSFPRNANQAMHEAQDQFWADRANMNLAAFQKMQGPTTLTHRLLKWWHDLPCPPSDSRKPSKLLDLNDYLACPSPLANAMQWADKGRQGKVNDAFCDRVCDAIQSETRWHMIPFKKRVATKADAEDGTFFIETIATFHAVFAIAGDKSLLALIREKPPGPNTQELSLGMSFIPGEERAELEEFLA